ncbi:STAS domain-containing protein [Sneathiella sp. P13V-1]|uniref:STAS domain-containing protein n=1 Tax=Sneathiella sp. P13V-1 TaxID=2697366 RepID=UPI00187B7AFA|nr:STAS domain-containing protein [Sneathiella sp. P13V-1]MBE7637709.1 STAS domain-containing protein [Sneathiella sp. P13V-1]
MGTKNTDAGTNLILPEILNLGVAEELREQFVGTIVPHDDLTIDAGKVETITTPCLQVLIAAGLFVENDGGSVRITNPTEPFTLAFLDLGLNDIFEKWSS